MNVTSKTPAVISSEIFLKSNGGSYWFILLEGDFDRRFWSSRVNDQVVRLIDCCGKDNVIGALGLLATQGSFANVVALVDKDYDSVLNTILVMPGLFYTDRNDLEGTLLCLQFNNGDFLVDRIFNESIDIEKDSARKLTSGGGGVELVRSMAANYGVLRLFNAEKRCGVNFDSIPVLHESFLDHAGFIQDLPALKSNFVELVNSAGQVNVDIDALNLYFESATVQSRICGWDLVQGHDFLRLLAIAINSNVFRRESGHIQVKEGGLSRDLCLAVHDKELRQTRMFSGLNSYAANAGVALFR